MFPKWLILYCVKWVIKPEHNQSTDWCQSCPTFTVQMQYFGTVSVSLYCTVCTVRIWVIVSGLMKHRQLCLSVELFYIRSHCIAERLFIWCPSVCSFVCLSVHVCLSPSVYLSVHLFFVCLSVCLSACLCVSCRLLQTESHKHFDVLVIGRWPANV